MSNVRKKRTFLDVLRANAGPIGRMVGNYAYRYGGIRPLGQRSNKRRRVRVRYRAGNEGGRIRGRRKRFGSKYKRLKAAAAKKYRQKIWAIANQSNQICSLRAYSTSQMAVVENQCFYDEVSFMRYADIEAVKDQAFANYWGAANTAHVPYTQSLVEQTDAVSIRLLSAHRFYSLRNNGKVTVTIQATVYSCKQNVQSADYSPGGLWSSAMAIRDANQGITPAQFLVNPLFNIREKVGGPPTAFNKTWSEIKRRDYRLAPGDTCTLTLNRRKKFDYTELEQVLAGSGTPYYMKGVTQFVVFRLVGEVARDSLVDGEVGLGDGIIDYVTKTQYTVDVSAKNRRTKTFVIMNSSGLDAFTNAPQTLVDEKTYETMET